ncbi:MAG: hypothetical protein JSW61_05185 [Candidatus Thorarchaeota archaeon]|nr:MAG: hypothetical protein JSW61_05185 [Candidatus Thorarchaeota archaeon]
MKVVDEFRMAWKVIAHPESLFNEERSVPGYWPVVRFYLVVNLPLALLTPFVNWLHIPSDIVHAGTNAQMMAYVQAPLLEATTGICRYVWVAFLTYFGNVLKLPVLVTIFHAFAIVLKGSGTSLHSLKVGVYAASPVLLFGWIPFFGLISGLWVGYLYVVALRMLHESPMGPTIALINLLIGIQLVWAFLFGWVGSSVPW